MPGQGEPRRAWSNPKDAPAHLFVASSFALPPPRRSAHPQDDTQVLGKRSSRPLVQGKRGCHPHPALQPPASAPSLRRAARSGLQGCPAEPGRGGVAAQRKSRHALSGARLAWGAAGATPRGSPACWLRGRRRRRAQPRLQEGEEPALPPPLPGRPAVIALARGFAGSGCRRSSSSSSSAPARGSRSCSCRLGCARLCAGTRLGSSGRAGGGVEWV